MMDLNYNLWFEEYDLLFSFFVKTHLAAQESVALSKCHIFNNVTFWSQMLYYRGFSRNCDFLTL